MGPASQLSASVREFNVELSQMRKEVDYRASSF